jgi:hypothetical protein
MRRQAATAKRVMPHMACIRIPGADNECTEHRYDNLERLGVNPDPIGLKRKLNELHEKGALDESELHFIEQRIGTHVIPWFGITSVLLGCFAVILLEANTPSIAGLFTIAEGAAVGALVTGTVSMLTRERSRFIAAIGIFLAVFVLLTAIIVAR